MSFFEYRKYRQQYCRGCHANRPMNGASRCERHLLKSQKDRSNGYSRRLRNFLGQCMQYFVTAASAASFQRHPTPLHYTVPGDALFASCTLALPSVCTHDLVRLCRSTIVSTFFGSILYKTTTSITQYCGMSFDIQPVNQDLLVGCPCHLSNAFHVHHGY